MGVFVAGGPRGAGPESRQRGREGGGAQPSPNNKSRSGGNKYKEVIKGVNHNHTVVARKGKERKEGKSRGNG